MIALCSLTQTFQGLLIFGEMLSFHGTYERHKRSKMNPQNPIIPLTLSL